MLPKVARLRKARDFRSVFAARGGSNRGGRVLSTASIVLHASPRRMGRATDQLKPAAAPLRFGFSISKKVSKRSHDRNRLKRRLSEIARTQVLPRYQGAARYDCVVVVRQGAVDADSTLLRRDLLYLLRRAGIYSDSSPGALPYG